MITRFNRWRIRRIAKKTSLALKELHGEKTIYSAAELEDAIRMVGLSFKQRVYAYAMFTGEEICNGFLSKIGSSKTARELRFFMGGCLFGDGHAADYGSAWNRFHDYNNEVLGGFKSLGSSGSGISSGDAGDDTGYDAASDYGGND